MDRKDRQKRAEHTDATAHPQRAERGHFAPGNKLGRGGRKSSSITQALRSRVDPERIAEILLDLLENPSTNAREKVQVASLIYDRLEGRPLQRQLQITGDLDGLALLSMSPTERLQFLAEVKSRRMLGDHSDAISDDDPDRDPDSHDDRKDQDPDLDRQGRYDLDDEDE